MNDTAPSEATVPCCLLTGFEPFDGDALNPSWLVAQALDGARLHGPGGELTVRAVQLPCAFATALPSLQHALRRHRPRQVVALGQAGRSVISVERVAINVEDARIPDNRGAQPIDRPVRARGPAAYFSTLPIKAIWDALRQAGIAAEVSQTAGTFVCNHVFYGLMHLLRRRPGVRGGLIHVPMLPEQAATRGGAPGMALDRQIEGVRLALTVAAMTAGDAALGAGRED
jgi:pyroglutamyl-peptidase